MLPMPGSPSSSWAMYRARLSALFEGAEPPVVIAFWLFGTALPITAYLVCATSLETHC